MVDIFFSISFFCDNNHSDSNLLSNVCNTCQVMDHLIFFLVVVVTPSILMSSRIFGKKREGVRGKKIIGPISTITGRKSFQETKKKQDQLCRLLLLLLWCMMIIFEIRIMIFFCCWCC